MVKMEANVQNFIDEYKIDGDKILFHTEIVKKLLDAGEDWEKAKKIYPIYVEISPSGACNHRCNFCAVDFIGYVNRFLDTEKLKASLSSMGKNGVKSVMFAGEGEPLLHKDLAEIIVHSKVNAGIDVSITTNATALTDKFLKKTLPYITWIKASINAGTAEDYQRIHRTDASHFELALKNMANAVKIREEFGLDKSKHTLGAQMVLLPDNREGAIELAKRAKEIGLDYLVIKPYSQNLNSNTVIYNGTTYDDPYYVKLWEELQKLNTDDFQVVFRKKTMEELEMDKPIYHKCQSTPLLWAYIMANGFVYGCSDHKTGNKNDKFNYGDINEKGFQEIWEGDRRKENFHFVNNELDITECRKNCRMNQVNNTLWKLKKDPHRDDVINKEREVPNHVNFI